MNILIIDDNTEFIEILKRDLFYHFCHYYEKVNFTTSKKALTNIDKHNDINIAFIDIDLPNKDGISFAKEFREKHPKTILVFISSYIHLVHDTLVVHPFYFIRKSAYDQDINTFFKLISDISDNKKTIDIICNGDHNRIFVDDIIYIESQGHKLFIHTIQNLLYDNRTLKEILAILPNEDFIRIHKSFIININFLTKITTNSIILNNKIDLKLGRSYKNDFERFYKEFLLR